MKPSRKVLALVGLALLFVLLFAARSAPQGLQRPLPEGPPVLRLVDSTSGINCYVVTRSGAISCATWYRP
jgi:hypothetical protein